jgi:hypothetical protein
MINLSGICIILTARAIIPIMSPVLMAVPIYGDTNTKSVAEGGLSPFFNSPI